jgi:hypothetical protein
MFVAWFFEALESWGISKAVSWVASFFRRTPEKDMEKAHEIDNKIDSLSPADIERRVRESLSKD